MTEIPKAVWDEILNVAMADGIISNDEEALLDNIKKNLTRYYMSLNSEVAKDEEDFSILESQLDIMTEAYQVAYEDGKITFDELELIKKLQIVTRKIIESHKEG